jgi:hypothetical protein
MNIGKSTQRLVAWIAALAILLSFVAPSISLAIAANETGTSALIEVCSTNGIKFVRVADDRDGKSGTPSAPPSHAGHCPFCCTHSGSFGLPPSGTPSMALVGGHQHFTSTASVSPLSARVWQSAQPRAPPSTVGAF